MCLYVSRQVQGCPSPDTHQSPCTQAQRDALPTVCTIEVDLSGFLTTKRLYLNFSFAPYEIISLKSRIQQDDNIVIYNVWFNMYLSEKNVNQFLVGFEG